MTLKAVFRPAARAEFDGATLWYEDRRPGLGAQFVSEIDNAVELASKYPDRYPVKRKEIRCVRARRFPYSIYYIVEIERIVGLGRISRAAGSCYLAIARITTRCTRRAKRQRVLVTAGVKRHLH